MFAIGTFEVGDTNDTVSVHVLDMDKGIAIPEPTIMLGVASHITNCNGAVMFGMKAEVEATKGVSSPK